MKREIRAYLEDILTECNFLLNNSQNLSFEEFLEDEKTKRAFVRSLEIIGEATKKLPKTLLDKYPNIRWKEVKGMRDVLIHDYFGIDYMIVWNTVKVEIPVLKETIELIFKNLENETNKTAV